MKQVLLHKISFLKSYPHRNLLPLLLLFCFACLTGCDAEEESNECKYDYSGEPVAINASVDGIDDFFGGALTRTGETKITTVQPLDNTRDTGYHIETTVEALLPVHPVQTRGALTNVRFRLVAYKNNVISAANYAGTVVFSTNGSGTASVVSGTASPASSAGKLILVPGTYAFVCYSFNQNSSNPAMLSGNISTTVNHGQDFMVYKKTGVTVTADSSGEFTLGSINFSRLCARLQLVVTAEGFTNNKITTCAATLSNLSTNSASWSAGGTALSVSGSNGSLSVGWSSPNSSTVSSNYYTALPHSSRDVNIKFTSLTIDNASYGNKVSAKASGLAFGAGGNYKISVKVKQDGYIEVGGYKWAKGNLKSNFTFAANQSDYGDYVGWNTTDFGAGKYNSGSYSQDNDPCSKVTQNGGGWVTPSQTQLESLKNAGATWTTFNGANGYWFGGVNTGVFLPAAGWRSSDGSVGNEGTYGYYWRTTPSGSYAYFLYFYSSRGIYIGYYNRSYGDSVRCVKGP